jgi:hypothetical protein
VRDRLLEHQVFADLRHANDAMNVRCPSIFMQSLCHRSGFAASLRDAAVHVWCNLRDGMTAHLADLPE